MIEVEKCTNADWDEDDVIRAIARSDVREWRRGFATHHLYVHVPGDGELWFQVVQR